MAAAARTCRWASTGGSSPTSSATASAASPTSTRSAGNYTGGEQGWINLTTITDRATTKWKQFIAPTTPLPTGVGTAANYNQGPGRPTWSSNFDAGLFEGGGTMNTGIYRPVENCRMNGNTPGVLPGLLHVDQDQPRPRDRAPLP